MCEITHQLALDGVGHESENDRDRFRGFLRVGRGIGSNGYEDIDTGGDEFGGHAWELWRIFIEKPMFQYDGLTVECPRILLRLLCSLFLLFGASSVPKHVDARHLRRQMCARRDRQQNR